MSTGLRLGQSEYDAKGAMLVGSTYTSARKVFGPPLFSLFTNNLFFSTPPLCHDDVN